MEKVISPTVAICNGRETILLGTYNYMGMTFDPDVIAGGQAGARRFRLGHHRQPRAQRHLCRAQGGRGG
jgi:8-amino-7-oxononanoate synthase